MHPWRLLWALLLVGLTEVAAEAAEGEAVVGLEPGVAILSTPEENEASFAGGASIWLGLTDSVWAAASVGMSGPGGARSTVEAVGGLVLALDVLRIIPYAEAMAGVLTSTDHAVATLRLGLGADYLLTEHLSLGAVARYRPLPAEIGEALLTVEGRLAFRLEL